LIHAQAEGNEIVALLPSEKAVAVGDQIQLAVPMEKLHVFDPETEKTLAG
jgi:ABC-type sugar transport system ATPase subunit